MNLLEEFYNGESEQLNERPYSRTQSAIDKAKGKVKSFVGSGQVEQGAQEVGAYANGIWNNFKRYVGKKYGKQPDVVSYDDVYSFFSGTNLNTELLGTNKKRSFTPSEVAKMVLAAAREQLDEFPVQKSEEEPEKTNQEKGRQEPTINTKDVDAITEPVQSDPKNSTDTSNSGLTSDIRNLSSSQREALLNMLG